MRAVAAIMAAALYLALWWYTPTPHPGFDTCGFHWLTGLPCPLCGLTRGLCALAKGHWGQAVGYNALSPLGFVMLFSLFWNRPWRAGLWSVGIVAFAVYGVGRAVVVGLQ